MAMEVVKLDRKGKARDKPTKASSLSVGGHGCGNHSDMDYICLLYFIGNAKQQPSLFD